MSFVATIWDVLIRHADGREEIRAGVTSDEIRGELFRGHLSGEDRVRRGPGAPWRELSSVDEFDADLPQDDRRSKNALPAEDDFDMTPMIDVTFLLLIFFMVTASFHLQKGLDFPAKQDDKTPQKTTNNSRPGLPAFDDRIIVEIGPNDELSFKNAHTGENGAPFPVAEAAKMLKAESDAKQMRKLLIIAHESSSHEATVAVIDASTQVGILEISTADVFSQGAAGGAGPAKVIRGN